MSLLGSVLKIGIPLAATAIGGPAAGAAAGAVIGGITASGSSGKAAKAAAAAADKTIAAANANRDYQYGLNAPVINRGNAAGDLIAAFNGVQTPDRPVTTDWAAYVNGNPDALANWNTVRGTSSDSFGGDISKFGEYHYGADGSRRDLSAFQSGGAGSVPDSAAALATFRGSTGYQDLLKTGLGAVNANAFATGAGQSGAAWKALQTRGMNIADQSAQTWLGNLQNLQSTGLQGLSNVAGVGGNTVNTVAGANQYAGSAAANAALAGGASQNQILQNLLNLGAKAYGSSYGGVGG